MLRFKLEPAVLGYPLKLVLKALHEYHGAEAVATTLAEAGLPADRGYRLNEAYGDAEAQRLIAAAWKRITVDDVAAVFFSDTRGRFPAWFDMCSSSREFLEMQPEVHNTFAHGLLHPAERAAVRDKFRLEKLEDELVVHYRSANQLCDLYRAIARQVLRHWQESATIDEPLCMKRGDPECELHIRWTKP